MKPIGKLHYWKTGCTFDVIRIISIHPILSKVEIWNPRVKKLQERAVYGGHGIELTIFKEKEGE